METKSSPLLDNRERAMFITVIFWLVICLNVVSIISDSIEYSLLKDLVAGINPGENAIDSSDSRQRMISIFAVIIYPVTAIAFLFWFYRAYKNLVLGEVAERKYSTRWAIGGFFIPFANLVIPYRVMAELWKGSHALSKDSPRSGWKELDLSAKVGVWWALFIIANFIEKIAGRFALHAISIEGLTWSSMISIISDIINIPAALVTIGLIKDITRMQDDARQVDLQTNTPPQNA